MDATRKIGDLEVSVAGLGCNNFGMRIDEDASKAVVDAAIDAGITHFDTADLYGGTKSEVFLGRALGARRDDVIVATKFGMLAPPDDGLTGGHPDWVAQAVDASLERLGTDRIDLYWLHAPDATTPIGDTLAALDALVEANVPQVTKAVRWNSPFYGIAGQGWFLGYHVFAKFIKVSFFKGASLNPAPEGGSGEDARWINVHEGGLDEAQMVAWIRQAAALPGWGKN